jgi:hypothetical protein
MKTRHISVMKMSGIKMLLIGWIWLVMHSVGEIPSYFSLKFLLNVVIIASYNTVLTTKVVLYYNLWK